MQMKNAERDYTVAYRCFDVEDPALQDPFLLKNVGVTIAESFFKHALNLNYEKIKKLKKVVDKK